jgi:triacylglycerol lipase
VKRLRIDDFDIAYLEGGKGEPLVLLHGIGADKDSFTPVAAHLTQHFQVIAIDLPGFGDSTRQPEASYAVGAQVDRLHHIVETLGLRRFLLGGSSMGGQIAASYAARFPEEVTALWLLAPAGVGSAKPTRVKEIFEESGRALLFARTPDEFPEVIRLVCDRPPWMPSSVVQVLGERSACDYALHSRILREILDEPALEDRMRGSKVPALVVWGERDRVLDVSGARLLQSVMPRAELVLMNRVAHLPMLEAPRRAAKDLVQFWRRVLRGAV